MGKGRRKSSVFIKQEKIQDVSINGLKIRLSVIVDRLNQLIKRVTEKTELGVFLIDICQAEMYSNQQQKADFLTSLMGKGILLLSLSMIKYSWYTVMKQNCERLDRIAKSTSRVKMLAAASKNFVMSAKSDDDEIDYEAVGSALTDEEEEE